MLFKQVPHRLMNAQPNVPPIHIATLQQLICTLRRVKYGIRAVLLDQQVGGAPDVAVVHGLSDKPYGSAAGKEADYTYRREAEGVPRRIVTR